jgi:hypothetical protein
MPEWTIQIYYDGSVYDNKDDIICKIECMMFNNFDMIVEEINAAEEEKVASKKRPHQEGYIDNVDFCDIQELPFQMIGKEGEGGTVWSAEYMHAAAWKWLPLGDSFVDVASFRDLDNVLSDREYL